MPQDDDEQLTAPLPLRCADANGLAFDAELTLTPMHDAAGRRVGWLGVVRNISERIQAEREREQTNQRLMLLNTLTTGLRTGGNASRVIADAVDSMAQLFTDYRIGYAELDNKDMLQFQCVHTPAGMPDTAGISTSLAVAPRLCADIRRRPIVTINDMAEDDRAGSMRPVLNGYGVGATLIAPIRRENTVVAFLCMDSADPCEWSDHEVRTIREVADCLAIAIKNAERDRHRRVTEANLRQREQQLRHQAYHDGLTGLANRTMFQLRLAQAIERARNDSRYHFAVLFLDFDQFKYVNDSLGHDAGDALLVSIAARLRKQIGQWAARFGIGHDHMAARVGGDEFLILVDELTRADDVSGVARSLLEALSPEHNLNGQPVVSTASIGIVNHDGRYRHPEEIIRDADIAMYRAKADGRGRYAWFDAAMRAEVIQRARLERDLRAAVANRELRVHYQPIIHLDVGGVHGFEALVRWPHPEMGMVPPHRFLPLIDELDLAADLGRFILIEACGKLAAWRADATLHTDPIVLHINLFHRQLLQGDLLDSVRAVLAETGLPATTLCFEIDEATLVKGPESVARQIQQLHDLGVRITMVMSAWDSA